MKVKSVCDKTVSVLVVFLLLLFTSLSNYSWGRYVYLGISVAIVFLYAICSNGKIRLKFDSYQKFFLIFAAYTGLSSIWAFKASDSVDKMLTLISLVIVFYPIYAYYRDFASVRSLLNSIKWGGIAMSLYTISFYGLSNLMRAGESANLRMDADYANPNTLGLFAAVAFMIQVWQLLFKQRGKWEIVTLLPLLLVIGASQSRKAIVFIVFILFVLVILKNTDRGSAINTFVFIVMGIIALFGLLIIMSRMELFAGVTHRLEQLLNSFTGAGKVDHSTIVRNEMKSLGITWWKTSPIFGIGMANPHILAQYYLGTDAYLHNNYMELLCGGGIVGVIIYYSQHVHCLTKLIKYRHVDRILFVLMITWLMVMLIMDYGKVSYYSKLDVFFLMTIFLAVREMHKKAILDENTED